MNLSMDGQKYDYMDVHLMCGMYFFLDDEISIDERQLYSFFEIISELGGLISIFYAFIKIIVEPITMNYDIKKIISLYYLKKRNKVRKGTRFQRILNQNKSNKNNLDKFIETYIEYEQHSKS